MVAIAGTSPETDENRRIKKEKTEKSDHRLFPRGPDFHSVAEEFVPEVQ